nr:hypothetical protein [Tanacetum cinerariifolium]
DVDINQGRGLQLSQDIKDSHVTLTLVHPDGQQESSSVSSQFVSSMLNPTSDAGMESIFATASSLVAPLQTSTPIMTPSTIAIITSISHTPIPPMTIPSNVLQNLSTFDLVFRFDERLKSLEASFSEYKKTNPFAEAVSNILGAQAGLLQGLNLDRRRQASLLLQRNLCRLTLRLKNPHTWCFKQQADSRSSFNELLDTLLDFSNFIMNRLRVDTLTLELLAGPTYELMKGS